MPGVPLAADLPYLDVSAPGFSVASAAVQQARTQGWCARTPYGLAVLRYEEMGALLKDRRLKQGSAGWPAHHGVTSGPVVEWWARTVLNLEGKDHHRLRRLLNPAFSPRLIADLRPRFTALADELVDGFAAAGRCEFMADFAIPYAGRVIAIMLGIPEEQWEGLAGSATALGLLTSVQVAERMDEIEAAYRALAAFSDVLVADRERAPHDDFVTRLVAAQRDEDRLTPQELQDSLVILIFGGFDTTSMQLGLALQTFMDHPDQWERLAREPELGEAAVEEVMRINPTVTWVTREAVEDFEFKGVAISAGTTIHLFSQAAGTDPAAFPDPGFDITAPRRRHFGFGGGVHHCIGHFVARGDMSEALPRLAQRLRWPQPDGAAASMPQSGNTGPVRLPIRFEAG
jgi:cytochrome P450